MGWAPNHAQGAERQFIFQRSVQCLADDAARISVQDDGQEHKLIAQPDITYVSHPQRIGAGQGHFNAPGLG